MIGDPSRDHLRGAVVLVVDDDREQAATLAELLCYEGIAAISESDPRVVLTDLIDRPLDALILDVDMRWISGPALLAAVRTRHPDIPAIFLTGYELRDAGLADALATGRVAHLTKPTKLAELLALLARALADCKPHERGARSDAKRRADD